MSELLYPIATQCKKPTLIEQLNTNNFWQNSSVKSYWCWAVTFFAAFIQGCFYILSFCFFLKPGVDCQAKRQNKIGEKPFRNF